MDTKKSIIGEKAIFEMKRFLLDIQAAINETPWGCGSQFSDVMIADENGTKVNSSRQYVHVADAVWNVQARIMTLWVQIALGSAGGVCACAWLWLIRRQKSRVNVILLHVAIADLLVMAATLIQVVWEMESRWWLLGDSMCRIVKFFQGFTMMASSNMMVFLSLDRHRAIRSPLKRKIQVWKMSLPFWLSAALFSIPMTILFHAHTVHDPDSIFYNMTVCESRFRDIPLSYRRTFLTAMSVVHFFGPCLIICVCYFRMFLRIAHEASTNRDSSTDDERRGSVHLHRMNPATMAKARIKSLKMTVVIVTGFIICGLPYHILEMLFNFWSHTNVPKLASAILGALPVANSVINPYILLAFSFNSKTFVDCCRHGRPRYRHTRLLITSISAPKIRRSD